MATRDLSELVERCRRWAENDPDAVTRAALLAAIECEDADELNAAALAPLEFGTAGLRGAVGAGPGRMNLLTMTRLAWALGQFLQQRLVEGRALAERGVVVGHDARLDSARFAERAAGVLAGCGVTVWLEGEAVPTPRVAHAVRELGAAAALVVTASHNPRGDNGCKVYDEQGIQIVAPWDEEIAAFMEQTPRMAEVRCLSVGEMPESMMLGLGELKPMPVEVTEKYFAQVAATVAAQGAPVAEADSLRRDEQPSLDVAYTPLHGVGLASLERAIADEGIRLHVVEEQARPDGRFPTVAFPNPEEPGALDLLLALARRKRCELAVANDPDADRLCAAWPNEHGDWDVLSGDDLGILLADAALDSLGDKARNALCVATVVSSPALEALTMKYGARAVRTLTGFKWLCRPALDDSSFAFAYEEALGYCFAGQPGHLAPLDKDGISGAAVLIRLLQREGSGAAMARRLARVYSEIGLWCSQGVSVRFEGSGSAQRLDDALSALRTSPPQDLGGSPVQRVTDYQVGARARPSYLGEQNLLQFDAVDGSRVLVRPSGTEPKVKLYIHVRADLATCADFSRSRGEGLARAREVGRAVAEQINAQR